MQHPRFPALCRFTILVTVTILAGSTGLFAQTPTGYPLGGGVRVNEQGHPIFTVAGVANIYPMSGIGAQGEAIGFFPDLLREVEPVLGVQFEFVPTDWATGFQAVRDGLIDFMPSVTYTEERREFLDYLNTSLVTAWSIVYLRADSMIAGILDLQGREVGLVVNDQNGINLQNLLAGFDIQPRYSYFQSHAELERALGEGRVEAGAFFQSYLFTEWRIKPSQILYSPNKSSLATAKGRNMHMVSRLDELLTEWVFDHGSPYWEVEARYFGGRAGPARMPAWLMPLVAALVLVVLVALGLVILFRTLVARRTRELVHARLAAELVFNFSPAPMILVDANQTISDYNLAFVKLLESGSGKNLKGMPIERWFDERFTDVQAKQACLSEWAANSRDIAGQGARVGGGGNGSGTAGPAAGGAGAGGSAGNEDLGGQVHLDPKGAKGSQPVGAGDSAVGYKGSSAGAHSSPGGYGAYAARHSVRAQQGHRGAGAAHNLLDLEADVCSSEGKSFRLHIRADYLPSIHRYILVFTDLTELRDNQKQLEEINRNLERIVEARSHALEESREALMRSERAAGLGRMLAGLAHEVNTPIGVALTAATFLGDEAKKFSKIPEGQLTRSGLNRFIDESLRASQLIYDNLERAANLVSGFKQVSADNNLANPAPREIDLSEYVTRLVDSLSPRFHGTRHRCLVSIPSIQVTTIPGVLGQVLTNLIDNSLKYAFDDNVPGTITISARAASGQIELNFEDDGRGVTEANLSRIFEPFFTTGRNIGGTGLGLSIVHSLVTDKLGGEIRVINKVRGGLAFQIFFPMLRKAV